MIKASQKIECFPDALLNLKLISKEQGNQRQYIQKNNRNIKIKFKGGSDG